LRAFIVIPVQQRVNFCWRPGSRTLRPSTAPFAEAQGRAQDEVLS
jgi:hypothetical protein